MTVKEIDIDSVKDIFENQDWIDLNIKSGEYMRALRAIIHDEKLITFRFLPVWSDEKLIRVHMIFVTNDILYYSLLSQCTFEFSERPIVHMSVKACFHPKNEDREGSIEIKFNIGDTLHRGKPECHNLAVPWSMYGQVVTLLKLLNRLKADHYRNDNTKFCASNKTELIFL